jgi:hypothetical protein
MLGKKLKLLRKINTVMLTIHNISNKNNGKANRLLNLSHNIRLNIRTDYYCLEFDYLYRNYMKGIQNIENQNMFYMNNGIIHINLTQIYHNIPLGIYIDCSIRILN